MCVMLTEEIITLKYKASYLTYKLARSIFPDSLSLKTFFT